MPLPTPTNLLADLPASLPREFLQVLLSTSSFRIERIVSLGHRSPDGFWYDQEEHEWVLVLTGRARLSLAGGEVLELTAGSCINLPARTKHRVEWTDPDRPTVWLAVYYYEGEQEQRP